MGKDEDIDQFAEEQDDVLGDPGFDEDQELFEDETFGDEEFLDEEWENFDEGGQGEESEAGKRKKPNILLIGGGAAAAIAVIIFMMMGGGPQQPATQVPGPGTGDQAALQKPSGPPPTNMDIIMGGDPDAQGIEDQPQKEAGNQGGLLNNAQALKKIENIKDQFIFEEVIIESEDDSWPGQPQVAYEDPPMPAPMEKAGVLTPMPDPGNPSDTLSIAATTTGANTGSGTDPAGSIHMPETQDIQKASAAETSDSLAVSGGLIAKIDQIAARLEAMDSRLSRIEEETVTEKDLAALKSDIANLQETRAAKPATGSQQVAAASASSASAIAKTLPVAKITAMTWILKAAQPGSALVSRKGTQEVITLKVGDNLPGIGKIRDIKIENGAWVVIGSRGRILQ